MLRKATEKCFFHNLLLSVKFWFLVVAAELFCPVWDGRAAQGASLCAHFHAGTTVRDVAAHLSGRMSLTLSILQFKTILELPCAEKWSTLLSLMNFCVKIAFSDSTCIELRCFLLFMLGWSNKVQQWGIVDGWTISSSVYAISVIEFG